MELYGCRTRSAPDGHRNWAWSSPGGGADRPVVREEACGLGGAAQKPPHSPARLTGDVRDDRFGGSGGIHDEAFLADECRAAPAQRYVPQLPIPEFGYTSSWTLHEYPRLLGDVNGNGRDGIVGFGHSATTLRLS